MLSVLIRQFYSDFRAHKAHTFCFCSQTANLALKKPTAQSSTYNYQSSSENAVDGVRNTGWGDVGWCTQTNWDDPSWWRVDLGSNHVPLSDVFMIGLLVNNLARVKDFKITLGKYGKHSGLKFEAFVKQKFFYVGIQSFIESDIVKTKILTRDKPFRLVALDFYVKLEFGNVGF